MLGMAFYILGILFCMWAILWIGDKLLAGMILAFAWLRDHWA